MNKYNPAKIEKKWQKYWVEKKLYKSKESKDKPKYYVLDMFPYPSGAGLHVGHPKGYIATDVIARMKMMQGYNVLHPMGWDAFGLPAENYAIKNKVHPAVATAKNIKTFKKQLELLGFTYDWDREVNTTDPEYYKWTQWIFLQMFKKGLAYESYEPVNWCPVDKTVLANEDLENGRCERCGSEVEQRPLRQWVLKITDYAERLLNDLEKLPLWPEPIKEMQRNWIGRSEGATVRFSVIPAMPIGRQAKAGIQSLEVFTTRPDTLFGATYLVVAPEHDLVAHSSESITNRSEVNDYVEKAKKKTIMERTELAKEKTGVELKGIKAINPANGEELPIFVADYVLNSYGTGAIMAVPAHDERDWEFAKKYGLPIKEVVERPIYGTSNPTEIKAIREYNQQTKQKAVWSELYGRMINSSFLNDLEVPIAKVQIIQYLERNKLGTRKVQYKLRDWVFSRQRYWGEPIPLIKCEKCARLSGGQGWVPVPEKDLPLELPKVKKYEPTGTGESPLANIKNWVNTKCPQCGGPARRETNTMPQWAGSCWYYLAYTMPRSRKSKVESRKFEWDKTAINYWNPVDFYVGGAEHATRHLIYARFWHKFLYDIGAVHNDEPFTRLQNVGLILAEDGRKMSKRWNNVINPDDVVKEFGADALRVYEMFMGPFDQPCAWNTQGLVGAKRFLDKVWALKERVMDKELPKSQISNYKLQINSKIQNSKNQLETLLHKSIKKVTEDIGEMRFNTAISQLMILVNEMSRDTYHVSLITYKIFVQLLSPFAPHISEELWSLLGNKQSVFKSAWPEYDPKLAKDEEITLAIQVNGKLRDTILVSADIGEKEAGEVALASEKVRKWLEGKAPKKVIYVKGKLVSIVV